MSVDSSYEQRVNPLTQFLHEAAKEAARIELEINEPNPIEFQVPDPGSGSSDLIAENPAT